MRRWLAILMLVFLPLQFSWAAVADYCEHETGAAAQHIGHHDHEGHGHAAKDVDPGDQGKADGTAAGVSSVDCCHCHGCCTGIVDAVTALEPQAPAIAAQRSGTSSRAEPMPAQPERPQWAALA